MLVAPPVRTNAICHLGHELRIEKNDAAAIHDLCSRRYGWIDNELEVHFQTTNANYTLYLGFGFFYI